MKAILIYSGGLDSTTLLYEYKEHIALAVTFDYGSKHNAREIACAVENCRRLGIPLYETEGANHSLETGDVDFDIKNLRKVMKTVRAYALGEELP